MFTHKQAYDGSEVNVFTEAYGPDGALLWEKQHPTARAATLGYWDPISEPDTFGTFFGGLTTTGINQPDSLFLVRFDQQGNLMSRSFLTSAYDLVTRDVVRSGPNVYTAYSRLDSADGPYRAFLIRSDSTGAVVWERDYPTIWASSLGMAVNQNEEIFLTGWEASAAFPYRSRILKCDTSGDQIWNQPFMSNWPGTYNHSAVARKIACLDNGDPVLAGGCWDESGIGAPETEQFLTRLNTINGNKVWLSRFDTAISEFAMLDDVELASNGDLLTCGYSTPADTNGFHGVLYRVASSGPLLWKRRFRFLTGGAVNMLNDITELADGSIALCGTTRLSFTFGTVIWVLKLDADGCLVPGCGSVGVVEIDVPLGPVHRMWPNPSADVLHVDLDGSDAITGEHQAQYSIIGVNGHDTAMKGSLRSGTNSIDVRGLAPGTYGLIVSTAQPHAKRNYRFVVAR
ncbi:MAG: hypothetical protein IPJ87_03720 [Flavobacteriales bacterium]|nr:hypothetical protein [Flavobacteriales bacterium]